MTRAGMIPMVFAGFLALALVVACAPEHTPSDVDAGDGGVDAGITCAENGLPDDDGDGIANAHEGSGAIDTDRDGIPDIADLDSDSDEIPDELEAGRVSCAEEPVDTDGDGVYDFQDVDADGNGITDDVEGTDDLDGDGVGDWQDTDDDGDSIADELEVGPDPIDPADSDGDAIPDYHDRDSDNDGIPDDREGAGDIDRDGLQNFRDTDADGDGIPDSEEGVEDCDGDGLANFLDRDSDNDGLSDAVEREIRTDPCRMDTDEDGLTDLVERAIGSDPTDASSGIGEDEYMVILPYMDDPEVRELEFTTNIKQADVYFLIDTTGSMWGEQDEIRRTLSTFIVPEVASVVRDVQFGLGRFDDVPISPYGGGSDVGYLHIHDISGDIASVQAAIDAAGSGGGADGPESDVISLYAMATGEGVDWASVPPSPGCLEGRFGYPCFRPYSLPIVLLFTDYSMHNGPPDGTTDPYSGHPTPNWLDAVAALNDIGAKVLGFPSHGGDSSYNDAEADLVATAEATGAVRRDGTPLVFPLTTSGVGLESEVVDAISDLSTQVSRDVNTTVEESPRVDDGIDAADFVQSIIPIRSDPERGVDRFDDTTFYGVEAGTLLYFDVTFQNDIVPEIPGEPQVFTARIIVLGDNTVRLDDRRVIILVPPADIPIE